MAKQSGIQDRLYVGGWDLSGDVGALQTLECSRAEIDVTAINKSAHERILGLADVSIQFNAFYNDAAGRAHLGLRSLQTTKRGVLYCRGSTKGQKALLFQGKQIDYDWTRGNEGSLLAKVDIHGSEGDAPEWGELLSNALSTFSAAANLASRDDAAKSSKGCAAILQLTAKSATGTCTVRIQDSTDNALWTNLIAFTVVASGASRAVERKTVAGVVNRYMRVSTTGTAGTYSMAVATRRGSSGEIVSY